MNKYNLSFKSSMDFLKYIEDQDIVFVDLNFTDICGSLQHLTKHSSSFTKDLLDKGVFFDDSKLVLKPDLSSVVYDPFAAQKTVKIFCDIYSVDTALPYINDPRSIARAAEQYLKKSKIADTANFAANPEFYIFNDVQISTQSNNVSYKLDAEEGVYNKSRKYQTGNMGHRSSSFSLGTMESPVDSLCDIRAEMLSVMESMGVSVLGHSHSKDPSQCNLEIGFSSLLNSADTTQLYKYAVHNVANSYGRSATFMPKPINDDFGSSMVVNQSLWKSGKPIFSGKSYAGLSENAIYYIGGLLKHAAAISAFTNPTTNSYKRLLACEFNLGYSEENTKAALYIPSSRSAQYARIQSLSPDPMANPYLAFSAMLMAGLNGVDNKIHPGEELGNNNFEGGDLCSSLAEALTALKNDTDFLTKGGVFSSEFIDEYIKIKTQEIKLYESITHPIEVDMYYSG